MNNNIVKLWVLILILSSCSKESTNHEIATAVSILNSESANANLPLTDTDRVVHLNLATVDLPCPYNNDPIVLIPQINQGKSMELIAAKVQGYMGESIKPKAIKWILNGETVFQLTDRLSIPYELGHYNFEVIVTLINGNQLSFGFEFEVTPDLILHSNGYIDYPSCLSCLTLIICSCSQHIPGMDITSPWFICPGLD